MGLLVAEARVALWLAMAGRILDDPARQRRHDPVEASPLDVEAIQRLAWELLAVRQELRDARAGTTTLVADVLRVVRAS